MTDHRRPDVLHWVPRYLNRSERFVWQQLRDWRDAPDLGTVHVACRTRTEVADEFPHEPLSVLGPSSRLVRSLDFRLSKRLRRAGRWAEPELTRGQAADLRRAVESVDVVYSMFLWNTIELRRTLEEAATPLVVHVAGSDIMTADSRGSAYLEAVDAMLARADQVLCGSAFLRDGVLRRPVDPAKVHVHHFGIDVPTSVAPRAPHADGFRVSAISRLHPVKGVAHSIAAFGEAFPAGAATLTIAGDGPERSMLERLAAASPAADRITFLGEVSHDAVERLLQSTDLLIQHNVTDENGGQEGLGGTLLEAGAHGVPVVATRSGGVPEGVVDGETGILIEPGDASAMADAMARLGHSHELAIAMGAAGRSFVAEHHNARTQNLALARRLAQASHTQA